jgi:hypothetical protein
VDVAESSLSPALREKKAKNKKKKRQKQKFPIF